MTDADPDIAPGLRERKRVATRRAIQLAAISVVSDKGLDAATVDEIARVADISPRTFFNYFASKEEAIIGDAPSMPPLAAQEAFVADRSPMLAGIAELFIAAVEPALADHEIVLSRRSLLKGNPELSARRWATVHRFETDIVELVVRRLEAEDPELAAHPDELRSRARLTALVAVAAMRHAWVAWADDSGAHASLVERLRESFATLGDVLTTSTHA